MGLGDIIRSPRHAPASEGSRKERRAQRKAELDRLTQEFLAERTGAVAAPEAPPIAQPTAVGPAVTQPAAPAPTAGAGASSASGTAPVAGPSETAVLQATAPRTRKERRQAEEAAFLAQYLDWQPDADGAPAPAGQGSGALLGGRFDYTKGVAVGVIVGVLGTLGVQFGLRQVERIHLGSDPLSYVTVVDRAQPVIGDDRAIQTRLERDTHATWKLQTFAATTATHPGTLAANRARIEQHLTLPPAADYPLERVITNAFGPRSAHGTIYVLWFVHAYQAGTWLRTSPHVLQGLPADAKPLTMWAGDMVVYYVPGSTDDSAVLKTWLRDVSQCATGTGVC